MTMSVIYCCLTRSGLCAEEKLSFSEIRERANLPEEDLVRILHSLSCSKYKILAKDPPGKAPGKNDTFSINMAFTDRMRRIKVPHHIHLLSQPYMQSVKCHRPSQYRRMTVKVFSLWPAGRIAVIQVRIQEAPCEAQLTCCLLLAEHCSNPSSTRHALLMQTAWGHWQHSAPQSYQEVGESLFLGHINQVSKQLEQI